MTLASDIEVSIWTAARRGLLLVVLLTAWPPPVRADDFQGATHLMPFDEDTIAYSKTPSTGPVAKLQQRIDKGEVTLKRDEQFGYLLAILDELKVRKSSQMLVFSKTSFQRERIDPKHPRGVFFGDNAYVGYVPGSTILEISEADPKLGAVFYTFDQSQIGKAYASTAR